jgi:O-antigen/teichoic acid export membrane protein
MPQRFAAKAIVRSALLMTGSTYLAYAVGLVINTLIARSLGPADYGRYAYMIWLSGILVLLMNNGLTLSVIRFVSERLGHQDREGAAHLHGWFRRRQVSNALGVGLGFLLLLPWLKPAGWEPTLTALALFAGLALFSALAKAWYLFSISTAKGYGLFGIEAASMSWLSLGNLAAVSVLFALGSDLVGYLALFVVISIAHPLIAGMQLSRAGVHHDNTRPDEDLLALVRPHLMWTILSTLVWAFSNKAIETFLLNALVGAEAVGFFTIAAALTRGGVEMLSVGLTTVLMPSMANAKGQGGMARVLSITSDSARYFHFLGTLLAGLGLFWAGPAIVLMYGESYKPAILLLQVMVMVKGITLSHGALGSLLTTTDHQRIRVLEAGVSVGLSALFALWLVPLYGLEGAITAHGISTLLVWIFVVIATRRLLGLRLPIGSMLRMNLAGVAAAALSWVVASLADMGMLRSGVLAGFIFLVSYPTLAVLMRVFTQRDLDHLAHLGERRPVLRRIYKLLSPHAQREQNLTP